MGFVGLYGTYWPILPINDHKRLVFQVYLPSAMFVIVSWVSFLVKPEVVPGRQVNIPHITLQQCSVTLLLLIDESKIID